MGLVLADREITKNMPGAPSRLRCEFVSNPLGVTCRNPHLSWWVNDSRPAELQTAYEIIVASSVEELTSGIADIWRSGKVESDQSNHVIYGGPFLPCGKRAWWKVRTFDSDGLPSPWSAAAFFQMGMAGDADWHGHWIAGQLRGSRSRGVHAVTLRREFVVNQSVLSASLSICALGDYRVQVNGRQVAGADCNASWSDFSKEAYYQVFDVTTLLQDSMNCLGILLADGYYAGAIPGMGRGHYGDRPRVLVQLEITSASGERKIIGSDHLWRWRPSWVLAADIHLGEHVDARQYVEGWSEPGLDESGWQPVDVMPAPDIAILSRPHAVFQARQVLSPVVPENTRRNGSRHSSTYDFGKTLYGRAQLELQSSEADEIVLSYALDEAFSECTVDTYTSSGAVAGERYTGHFALHAFRYLRIEYTSRLTRIETISALRFGMEEQPSLEFRSDHRTLNNLFGALQNSLHILAQTVPMGGLIHTQRLPDVAYAATWVPIYARQLHGRALVGKWVADLQQAGSTHGLDHGGTLSTTAPPLPHMESTVDEFAHYETLVRTVWALYRHQNDRQVLQDCYGALRVAALSYKHRYPAYLRTEPAANLYGQPAWREPVATCCMHGMLRVTGRIAGVLGHLGDFELIENLAEEVRKAFRRRYLSQDGHLLGDCQSVYVAALYHNLLAVEEIPAAEQRLIELLQHAHYHPDVAPVLTHALLPVLTRAGRLDMAYMTLLQTSKPSWLAAVADDGDLIGVEPGNFDIAWAGVWEWLLESLIGLCLDEDYSSNMNGYRRVRVRPMPPFGAQFLAGSPVQHVQARLQTVHGHFEVSWRIGEDDFELELLIPPGCTALVTMPDGIEQNVQSGHHRFVMDFGVGGDGVPTLLDLAGSKSKLGPAA